MLGPDDRIATYCIERELGSTTTGVLYEAVHLVLPRRAVIKVGHPARALFSVQLLREACLLEALQHPGVPRVYESGMLPDRRPWFATELVEGTSLAARMAGGPLSAAEVIACVRDAAEILEHAHKRGVVRRTLRPEHVVVLAHPRQHLSIAITDWSEARAHDATTADAATMPLRSARAYLAPELARGELADDRADVYSLGVLAYQALTGGLPRGNETTPFLPAGERSPDAPRELTAMIDQMLAFDRFDRPTCAEIRADLDWLGETMMMVSEPAPVPVRIRKPRWTPAIPIVKVDEVEAAGEIIIIEAD